jgi:AGZA family xanthine/uracil permease-like MFS transporter
LVGAIPSFATSPALILVGGLMLTGLGQIEWTEPVIAIPAFLTVTTIPMTWSIADGLSFGLTSYAALEVLTGRAKRANWMLYLLAVLFLMRFFFIHQG